MTVASSSGLEGVVAADTAISDVDGERGRLVIAGRDVEVFAQDATFEDATACVMAAGAAESLIAGSTSHGLAVSTFAGGIAAAFNAPALGRARQAAWEILPRLGDALDAVDGMDALRASLAHVRSTGSGLSDAIAVIGGSIGSNLALVGCANDPDCTTAVALSPGLDYFGVTPETSVTEGLRKRSVLLVASQGDTYSADSVKQMLSSATGDVAARIYTGNRHGTNLLLGDTYESTTTLILAWLDEHTPEAS